MNKLSWAGFISEVFGINRKPEVVGMIGSKVDVIRNLGLNQPSIYFD